jgi:hypothetical protein
MVLLSTLSLPPLAAFFMANMASPAMRHFCQSSTDAAMRDGKNNALAFL